MTTLAVLSDALERKDAYTAAHARRRGRPERAPSAQPARPRRGADAHDLATAALLHDIGKIGDPHRDPHEAGQADRRGVRGDEAAHRSSARDMLARDPLLRRRAPLVRSAHERWDGGGYPDGLAGEDDPARRAHHLRLRRLPRDDLERPYKAAMPRRGGASRSCAALLGHAVRPRRGRRPRGRDERVAAGAPAARLDHMKTESILSTSRPTSAAPAATSSPPAPHSRRSTSRSAPTAIRSTRAGRSWSTRVGASSASAAAQARRKG